MFYMGGMTLGILKGNAARTPAEPVQAAAVRDGSAGDSGQRGPVIAIGGKTPAETTPFQLVRQWLM